MSRPYVIERLYAWVVTDESGEDGLPTVRVNGVAMPTIGADKERIESYRSDVEPLAAEGFRVRLVEFTGMITLEDIPIPPGTKPARHR